jgi:DNA-binding transcriptional MerR regulator
MPYKKPIIEKIHYSIGEVADMFHVAPSLLRYWEKEFKVIKPFKNKKGNRFYTVKDMDVIKYIYYLLKEKGLTIEGAKQHLKRKSDTGSTKEIEIVSKLNTVKEELLQLKQALNELYSELNTENHEQKES